MNNNMNNILQAIRMFKNPKNAVMNVAKNCNNPILSGLIQYAQQGREDKLEEFAKNYAKEHNINFEEQINSLRTLLSNFK